MTKALETLTGADADAFDAAIAPRVSSVLSTVTANLATDIATATVPGAASAVRTSGYASIGRGAAIYVEDSLATAPLAAVHPLFCKTDAGGRRFRLLPDAGGFLSAAASGAVATVAQDDSTNHRTALAALLAYAEAINARGIQFESGHYSIWTPLRTAINDDIHANASGVPFVLNKRMEFRAGASGTQFNRRKADGSDSATFAGTQTLPNFWDGGANVATTVHWRGGMFLLRGTLAAPANYADRSGLTLRGKWRIWGGLLKSATPGLAAGDYYPLRADGSGWDIRDKPIWAEQDRYSGDITYEGDITIGGFRGELHYQGGRNGGSVYQTGRLRMHDTDGDGFNPGPRENATDAAPTLQMEHLEILNAFNALEGAAGWHSNIKRLDIRDCNNAQCLWSGSFNNVVPPVASKGVLTINSMHVERSGSVYAVNGTRIDNALLIDSYMVIGVTDTGAATPTTSSNVFVNSLTVMADTMSISAGLIFNGYTAKGNFNNRVRHLHCDRSPAAIAGNFKVSIPYDAGGSLGDGVMVDRITGYTSSPPKGGYTTGGSPNCSDFFVGVRECYQDLQGSPGTATQNIETTPVLTYYYGPRVTCTTTTNSGIFPVTLPNMYPGSVNTLPKGARYEVANAQSVAVMAVQTTNTRMARRVIIRPGGSLLFEWDGSKWFLIQQEQVLTGSSAAVILQVGVTGTIPINGVSDETTFAVNGARAGMSVIVTPNNVQPADAAIMGRVTANDTVGIRAKNMNTAATLTMVNSGYAVELRYAT